MILKNIHKPALFLLSTLPIFPLANPAFAHKANIFAWPENSMVHTISKFSGGKRAKNSNVTVFDADDKILLKGKTDEKGEFSFPVPESGRGLKIVLEASMGHRSEWFLSRDEILGLRKNGDGYHEDGKRTKAENIPETGEKIPFARIISGLGYIMGIVGIALFFLRRGEKKRVRRVHAGTDEKES